MKLHDLGSKLGIAESVVSTHLYNERHDIREASHEVLKEWFRDQVNEKKAFVKMWEALNKSGLKSVIRDVLCKPPAAPVSGSQNCTPGTAI